jgi:putative nucleotidyltransferase with HDIG domain
MAETVLVVDDNPHLLSGLSLALSMNGYEVRLAQNGAQAIEIMRHACVDLIVCDIMMPEMDGFALLERVRQMPQYVTVPFLFLTALSNSATLEKARSLAADDFIAKPISPQGLAQVVHARLARARRVQSVHVEETLLAALIAMARAIESRDPYTKGHVERVAIYAGALARELGWSEESLNQVRLAAILHDVGKLNVPDAVLNKPGSLSPEEWTLMRQHPSEGAQILNAFQSLQHVLNGVKYHHERYNGTGYPEGLAGKHIPEIARILAIADFFDAVTSDRPYRKGMTHHEALVLLQNGAGTHFDPEIASAFTLLWLSPEREPLVDQIRQLVGGQITTGFE